MWVRIEQACQISYSSRLNRTRYQLHCIVEGAISKLVGIGYGALAGRLRDVMRNSELLELLDGVTGSSANVAVLSRTPASSASSSNGSRPAASDLGCR